MSLIGQHLGQYDILRLLGHGGMGEVYLAEDPRIQQQVAIKVLHVEGETDKMLQEAMRWFKREARIIAQLHHPHVLPLFRYDEHRIDEALLLYLVMPYCRGGSLADWLADQTVPHQSISVQDTAFIVRQVADALQYAHEHHVIHQDIKPSNILLRESQTHAAQLDLLLADFGVATLSVTTTRTSQSLRGTPAYMAPEQWEGHAVAASDQYALAVLIYECLTGHLPFHGMPNQVMYQHLMTPPPPLRTDSPQLSPQLEAIVMRALAKQPQQRFASIDAFASAFVQAASQHSKSEHVDEALVATELIPPERRPVPLSSPAQTPIAQDKLPSTPTPASPVPRKLPAVIRTPLPQQVKRRIRPLWLAGAFCLMLILIGTGIFSVPLMSRWYGADHTSAANAPGATQTSAAATARANPFAVQTAAVLSYSQNAANGMMFGLNAQHTHFNAYEQILSPANVSKLTLSWTASTGERVTDGGNFVSSPVIANGIVYIGSYSGVLYAFKATGCGQSACSPLWTAATGGIIFPTVAVANGVVYVGSFDHKLYAFQALGCGASSCSPLWTATVQSTIISSPTVANGMVYVGSDDHHLYAFKAAGCDNSSCSPAWSAVTGDYVEGSPAIADNLVFVGSLDHKFYAFNAAGCGAALCSPVWTATAAGPVRSSPTVVDHKVYVGSDDGKLYVFNTTGCGNPSCQPLWTAAAGGYIESSPAVVHDVIYVGSGDHKLYAFSATGCGSPTCSPLWTAATGNEIVSSPTVANGVVYIGSFDHKLYAFNAAGCGSNACSPLWTATARASIHASPAVANGMLYSMSYDSLLSAFHLPTQQ